VTGDTSRRGEFALIAELLAPLSAGDPRSLGLTDDAAVLPQRAGFDLVITTDTMVESVHFLAAEPADVVARRLLRVNLSDIAAMGARPVAYFLDLTLSDRVDDAWLEAFAGGLAADQDRYSVALLGGDTTRTPGPLTLSVTAMGEVPSGAAVRRGGAGTGDVVMVSGTIGDAFLGLGALERAEGGAAAESLRARYQLPEPRLALGAALRGIASAMADVSDGLVADLGHIAEASRLDASIEASKVPLSVEARTAILAGEAELASLITGGDDYELVFTVPEARIADAERAAAAAGVAVAAIGWMGGTGTDVAVIGADGRPLALDRTGYRHF
jgi:thiamine-monophosphate kinase